MAKDVSIPNGKQALSDKVRLPGASDSRVSNFNPKWEANYTNLFFGSAVKAVMDFSVSLHIRNVERVYHKFRHMSSYRVHPSVGPRLIVATANLSALVTALHRPTARVGPTIYGQVSPERNQWGYISRRPSSARPRVLSSAYSRSPPMGRPRARLVTRMPVLGSSRLM
jgi:hypothetical protein